MSNPTLQQTIEALAKEKGIEPEVIVSAIEEAVKTASRQVLQDQRGPARAVQSRDRPGGAVRGQADRRRGDQPRHRGRARRGAAALRRRGRGRDGDRVPEVDRGPRAHRRADRQAGHLPEGARGRAREHLRRVQPADRRGGERHDQAVRERRHHPRAGAHRGGAAAQGAVARRELRAGRPDPRRHPARQPEREGTADRPVAHRRRPAHQAVRAGSAGDLRRHGRHQGRRARGGRPRQGGGLLPRARRRPGRRLRRHEGHPRAGDHPRAARREDRHRRVVGRPDRRSSPTRSARPRCSACRSWTTTSA